MGRSPCCDKNSVKKGPWTPEEDIILVDYIQQYGPFNWRSVPINSGLMRCSKSCRLRWTNYLRPGIKRGNFTEDEDRMIIHLQALLGNRWASIASYLPQRTDNDIKNYWNTHLKKKLSENSFESGSNKSASSSSKGQWEKKLQTDLNMAREALCKALSLDKSSSPSSSSNPNTSQFTSSMAPSAETTIAPLLQISPVVHTTSYIDTLPAPIQTTPYIPTVENIACLLETWGKKKAPYSSQTPTSFESSSFNSCNCSSTLNFDVSFYGKGYDFGNFVSENGVAGNVQIQDQGQDLGQGFAAERDQIFNEMEMPLGLQVDNAGVDEDFIHVLNDDIADLF